MKKLICILLTAAILTSVLMTAITFTASADIVPAGYGYGYEEGTEAPYEEETCEPLISEFYFRELPDGTYEVYDFYDNTPYHFGLEIPSSYNGKAVTSIAKWNSYDRSGWSVLTIPETITHIEDAAFSGFTGLRVINYNAVDCSCTNAFSGCTGITKINIGASVRTIPDGLFRGLENVKELSISDSVTMIGSYAFSGLTQLESLTIPEKVQKIGEHAFSDCSNLTDICYNAVDCQTMGEYVTYDYNGFLDVTPVFDGCSSVRSVEFGENVRSIPSFAFWGVGSLDEVTVPAGIERIGGAVFGSTSVDTLHYSAESCTEAGLKWYEERYYWDDDDFIERHRDPFEGLTIRQVNITAGVRELPQNMFQSADMAVLNIEMPITRIGGFSNCADLERVILPQTVTEIEANAFFNCNQLADIDLPESITAVGEEAFYGTAWLNNQPPGCVYVNNTLYAYKDSEELTDVTVREGTTAITRSAFSGADHIRKLTLPGSLQTVDSSTFQFCSGLQTVTLENGITEIGDHAFYQCDSLETVNLPDSLTAIGSNAFHSCAKLKNCSLPDSLTTIGDGAFSYCQSLTEIVLPDSLRQLGDSAFSYCRAVKKATIGAGLTKVASCAFCYCTSLESVEIPDTVTVIDSSAFNCCTSLESVTLPDTVTEIGVYAFRDCQKLKEITLPNGVTVIGDRAFSDCSSLTSIDIPDGIQTLGEFAFYNCKTLKSARIGTGLTALEYGVFKNCGQLESVILPDGLTELKSYEIYYIHDVYGGWTRERTDGAFENCAALTKINIPDTVQKIDKMSFANCTSLKDIRIGKNVVEIGENAFFNTAMKSVVIKNPDIILGEKCFGVENSVYGPWPVDGFVVYGYQGSTAEAYAKLHKLRFEKLASDIRGDADGDGHVSIIDASCIRRHLAKLPVYAYNESAADTDGDDTITVIDATNIQRYLAGLYCPVDIGTAI